MDAALLQSGYLPVLLPASVSQAGPSAETVAPEAGPSHKHLLLETAIKPVLTDDVVMSQPPVTVINQHHPSLEVPETPGANEVPEEDELTMSRVEDTTRDTVKNVVKGATKDASEA